MATGIVIPRSVLRFGRCADVGVRIGATLAGDLREAARECGVTLR